MFTTYSICKLTLGSERKLGLSSPPKSTFTGKVVVEFGEINDSRTDHSCLEESVSFF